MKKKPAARAAAKRAAPKKKPAVKAAAKKAAARKPAAKKAAAKKARPAARPAPKPQLAVAASPVLEAQHPMVPLPHKPGMHLPLKPAPAYAHMIERAWAHRPPPHKITK